MRKENEYGRIIAYERKRTNLSVEQLCDGICSPSYLQRIEKGERSCEKILADGLLQRMGVSAEKFSYLVNVQERELIVLKEKIVDLVNENQKEEAYRCIENYKELTKEKSVLYIQFCMLAEAVLEWRNGGNTGKILKKILEAWNMTRKNKMILRLRGQHLSYYEMNLAMLYMRLLEEEAENETIKGYQDLLTYLEKRVEEPDRVKWYPQIAYRLIQLLRKNNKMEQALVINEKAIQLLQKQASVFYLAELLETYMKLIEEKFGEKVEDMSQDIQKQMSDMEGIGKALNWCYQEYKVTSIKWIWDIPFGMSEIYLCQDIVRGRRIGMGMSQEELAEGICDPVTISRIECGKSYPKRKVLVQLLQKLKWTGENCTLTAQIGDPEYHRITSQISSMTYLGKHAEAKQILEELDEKIEEKNVFAKQYFLINLGTVEFALGKKSSQEFYNLAEEALYLTVPRVDMERLKKWHFTRCEVMCINMMSYACESVGEVECMIELLEIVKKFYEKQKFKLAHYRAGYELTLRNLDNLLGNIGQYKKSILLADVCIKRALCSGRIGNAAVALYDKGWGMERLYADGKFTKKESLNYIKASYYLSLFIDKKNHYKHCKKHIKELYGDDI